MCVCVYVGLFVCVCVCVCVCVYMVLFLCVCVHARVRVLHYVCVCLNGSEVDNLSVKCVLRNYRVPCTAKSLASCSEECLWCNACRQAFERNTPDLFKILLRA